MLWRHLCLVRAWSAAGLLGLTASVTGASAARAAGDEPAPRPEPAETRTISVLDARKAGDLAVDVRGAGEDRVKMTLKNTSAKRLNVVLPPGLVASSAAAQGRGGGGGGGFQSMGLGSVSNRPGGFGEFRTAGADKGPGFRSVDVTGAARPEPVVTVPVGETVDLTVVSVCLNFGVTTPAPKDVFELVDVDDYTTDPRVRKALRSLATYGTSQGVAQSVMWRVCNDVPFGVMARRSKKVMNLSEIALAARFVEALDASNATDLVDPAYLQDGRVFVRVSAEGDLAKDADRLAREVEGLKVFGLPVRAYMGEDALAVASPGVLLHVTLTATDAGSTRARVAVSQADDQGRWTPLGKATLTAASAAGVLDGATLARSVDRAVAAALVTVKPVRRSSGSTTFRVDNRLPFTLCGVSVKAGDSSGAPVVELTGLGVAPSRSALVAVEAPTVTVDHVEVNGL